ncbi:hypothetical protein ASF93_09025 [Microbacterium sp. Leaf347]|nr:hypothetical protein ASF93_09025 [Microbacterium sp. Leaf347]KQR91352.1 hypothetical protein ASG00_05255 [Microbacterium sp. Leaf351]ODU78909.1 MAG: hypothetical protein ABT08_02965 [Microbacterium sp. SCN 71-21]OJU74235.1 MAG: hypothetical protein BGO15_12335 [Microbacterium sp. 71-23]
MHNRAYAGLVSDVRPPLVIIGPRGRLVILAIACAIAAAMGIVIVLLNQQNLTALVVGVAAVGVFGVGGGYSLIGQWRRSRLLRVDDAGIRLGDGASLAWRDIDRVGVAGPALGIRLRSADAYLSQRPRGVTVESLQATRRTWNGFDIVLPERDLGMTATAASAAVRARKP